MPPMKRSHPKSNQKATKKVPPSKVAKAKSSHQDTITKLFQNLPSKYKQQIPLTSHSTIITKAQETLRLLNCKIPLGQKLCIGDSTETRSAVILEYLLRKGIEVEDGSILDSVRVPLVELGKSVGTKKQDIEKLSKFAMHYLDKICTDGIVGIQNKSISSSSSKLVQHKRQPRVMSIHQRNAASIMNLTKRARIDPSSINNTKSLSTSSNQVTNSHYSTITKKQQDNTQQRIESLYLSSSCINFLSIKLQSYLHDPDNIERKSNTLWWNLIQYKIDNHKTRREAAFYDLQTNVKHYEGACFYYTVCELELGPMGIREVGSGKGKARGNKRVKNSGNRDFSNTLVNERNINEENDIEETPLTKDDIVNELRIDLESFSTILEEVTLSALKMGKPKYVEVESQKQVTNKRLRNETTHIDKNNLNVSEDVKIQDFDLLNQIKSKDENEIEGNDNESVNFLPNNSQPNYVSKETFMEWKNTILLDVSSQHHTSDISSGDSSQHYRIRTPLSHHADMITQHYNKITTKK